MVILTNNISPTPRICLNMIVKNESQIIRRLFDSVISIIDCYCICDTGSTDDTIQIITDYFKEKNIPGKVVSEPFKNFCYNRNFALQSCLNMSDFILLLDADMILELNNFDKNILKTSNCYTIHQGNDNFFYQNIRIINNNGLYKYIGVTHEYIEIPPNYNTNHLEKQIIFIRDIGDGGAKSDKFERDIQLLTNGIIEEPNNARYYFYLGNSYHDLGKFKEAIDIYKKRIELGGWKEEIWYSYYRIGLCYKNIGKITNAIFYWMEGYNYYPERLENIYEIIQYYRINSKDTLAQLFYEICKKILDKNLNRDNYLFLHNDVYTSRIYYEYSIFAFYNNIKNINDEIIHVLNNSNIHHELNNLLQNMKFYKDILIKNNIINLNNKITLNINNEPILMTSSSSCLIPNESKNGYIMNIRYVNYHITDQGHYLNCDNHIITANRYVELDSDLNILFEKFLSVNFDNRRYIGIEDVKIFYNMEKKKLEFIGTGYHQNNNIGIVSGDYDFQNGNIIYKELFQSFQHTTCEKNWVFVNYKNKSHIIYDWYPLKIGLINENNELNIIETKKMPKIFSRIRGSTCGFKYLKKIYNTNDTNDTNNINIDIMETEIWFVTHMVSYEEPRHYYHILVVFDSNMNLLRYSAPFKFEGEPIEYCLSIVVEDDRVLINYSTWDRTTIVGIYDKKYIDSIVKYV